MYRSLRGRNSSDIPKTILFSKILFTLIAFFFLTLPLHARNLPTQHVRDAVHKGQAKSLGRIPATQTMQLDLVLPLKDRPGLQNFLQQLYDPSSPLYRHYLGVKEFTEKFGPTQDDYDAVVKFAKANGFKVVGGSRDGMNVQLKGSVATVEKALHVKMGKYQHPTENRAFYAPDREPTLELPVPLWHISGLDNYSIPRPTVRQKSTQSSSTSTTTTSAASTGTSAAIPTSTTAIPNAITGSCPEDSFCGSDMRSAYYGGTLTGAGQSIGLLQYWGYDISDLDTYYRNTGQTRSARVVGISTDGTSLECKAANGCDDTEQLLDMTQALGMAPGIDTLYVFVGSSDTAIFASMTTASPLPAQLSCSWMWIPADPEQADPYFERMAAQGQSFLTASGDWGYWYAGWFSYPADDANVTSVGGTSLSTINAGSTWSSETAWETSGGGISPDGIPIPWWQQIPGVITSANRGSTLYRNGPDVSANADYSFYVCSKQTNCTANVYGGTSFAAPMWAGYIALANQQAAALGQPPVGFLNPAVYALGTSSKYQNDFHDVTSGGGRFPAGIGFDLITGWGSPNGANLINDLATANPVFFLAAPVLPAELSVPQGGAGNIAVNTYAIGGFDSDISLTATGQPAGVSLSFSPASIAAPGTGSSVLTVQASAAAALGVYPLTITGTGGGMTRTLKVDLTINGPATHLALKSPTMASSNVPFNFEVIAQDALNHTSTGYTGTVRFSSSDPLAVLPANATLTNGKGAFSATLYTRDAQTLTVADTLSGTIAAATANLNVGVPTHLSVMLPSLVGTTYEFKYYVTAIDQYGGVAPGYTGKVHFTSSDPLAVLPGDTVLKGMGSFMATLFAGGTQTLSVTDTANASMSGSGTTTVLKITAQPMFTPAPVITFNTPQSVTLSDSTAGAKIYYTVDGSTPTSASTLYTGPIAVNTSMTINAIGIASGYDPSLVATGEYILVAASPTFQPAPVMNFTSAQSVTLGEVTPGVSIYYTKDGSTPTTASTLYTGPIAVNTTTTIQAIATGNGFQTSPISSATYTLVAATPSFTPGATGNFSSPVSVKLTDLSSGVSIYYTKDGSTPTTASALYSGAFTLNTTTVVKAIAVGNGYAVSSVATATYTFAAAAPSFTPGASASFSSPVSLKITDLSPGVSIYYTKDGSTPTTSSTLYTGAFTLNTTTTVKAIAAGNGYDASAVATATYTFVAATPAFTPGAYGTFSSPVSLRLSDLSPGVSIYYTKDGSTPTTASTLYTGPIALNTTATIKAIASGNGYGASAVATAIYTFVAAAPSFTPGAYGTFSSPVSVSLSDVSPGVSIYYTKDGSTPTTASTLYTGPIALNTTTTIRAIASGNGYGTSPVASATYNFVAATPTFSPYAGTYSAPVSVRLADISPGVPIYYTTDGSTPTTSSNLYTGPFTVSTSKTVRAIASGNGYGTSAVASATYTITQ
jgi:pro-kumamolisin-like protein/chitobiase/beta-hexosaminidase-like protein